MAYVDQNQSKEKTIAAVITAIILAVVGYAFVTGLAFNVIKKTAEKLNVIDIKTPPPPPPKKPPPPPKETPKVESPPIVTPPPIVQPPQVPSPVQVTPIPQPPRPPVQAPVAPNPPPPPPAKPSQAIGAKAKGDPNFGISDEDYPTSASRNQEQGTSRVTYDIDTTGRVQNCQVTGSSGFNDLDQLTCTLITRRARYTPAKDTAGNPIASHDGRAIKWVLPKD